MGNCTACAQGRDNPRPSSGKTTEEQEQESGIAEDETIVPDNRDGYFTKEDIVAIAKKYPEYKEWEKQSKESRLEAQPKQKKIKWKEAELIGHGSFGRVVLGLNLNTGELMAVKQVYLGGLNSDTIQDRIQALEVELDLLSEFSHKNIVRYIGSMRNEQSFSIFLEYVSGGTIASIVSKYGPLNEQIIKQYVKQILEGLEYLHARNIIHRDIKGANVLVDNNGVCKLADFGSAKNIYNLIEMNSLKGTANWMAPEVIQQKNLGRFSDIWSIGCVVIEMSTGKPPWSGGNQMATMFQIAKTKTPPPFPPGLSEDCYDFLNQCLKVNPRERANVTTLLKHNFLKDVDQNSHENLLGASKGVASTRLTADKLKSFGSTKSNGTQRDTASMRGSLKNDTGADSPKQLMSLDQLRAKMQKDNEELKTLEAETPKGKNGEIRPDEAEKLLALHRANNSQNGHSDPTVSWKTKAKNDSGSKGNEKQDNLYDKLGDESQRLDTGFGSLNMSKESFYEDFEKFQKQNAEAKGFIV